MTRFELVTAEPFGGDNIALFAREKSSRNRVRIDVTDFEPYFYIHADNTEQARRMKREGFESRDEEAIRQVVEGDFESIRGHPLTKVVLHKPGQTRDAREQFESPGTLDVDTWESDVNYTMRLRVDAGIKCAFEIPQWALQEKRSGHYEAPWVSIEAVDDEPEMLAHNFYFDIEVGGENQALPGDEELNPVVCITAMDGRTEKLYSWVWRDDLDQNTRQDAWFHEDVDELVQWEIREFDSEMKMLANFFNFYKEETFDIISGWYSDKYDVPYLINRADDIGLDPSLWSEMGEVNDGLPEDSWGQANVKGAFMNDLERRYDKISSADQSGLEYVAAEEEEIMSWPQESSRIDQVWKTDLERLLEYNANDVVATQLVDEVAGVTEFFLEKMYMTGCRVEEIEQDSNVITYYHLFEADPKTEIIPRGKTRTHKEFGGGRVIIPDLDGIVGPVAVLDLSKIYPSIMITLGLSFENAAGVDPVLLGDSLSITDEMGELAYMELPENLEQRAAIENKSKEDSDEETIYELQWEFQPGDVLSPLALGKKGRKFIWNELYDMQADGSLEKTMEWEFVHPSDQEEYEAWLPVDHRIDITERGSRLPNGVRIDQNHDGLTTRCLEQMFELRYKYGDQRAALDPDSPTYRRDYKRLSNKRQNAKDQINAVFGYAGYKKSPLFSPEIAMTTTFVGRNIIKMCQVITEEELGHKVVYGDTDSIFVLLEDQGDVSFDWEENPKECVYEGWRLGEYINAKMDDFAVNFCGLPEDNDHMFELEFEKMYSSHFQGDKKKRYSGFKVYDEG